MEEKTKETMSDNDKLTSLIRQRVIGLVDDYLKGELGINELVEKFGGIKRFAKIIKKIEKTLYE